MTRVRLTFAARQRFPDIGTSHGTTAVSDIPTNGWYRVTWPGRGDIIWLRAEDLEPVTDQPEETP